jgi:xanthine dehydrogenase accessory factor
MRAELLAALNAERAARRACVLVTDLGSGEQRLVRSAALADDPLAGPLEEQLRLGKSALIEVGGRSVFLSVHVPPVRLIAIGAVHISQALAPIAKLADLDITIVDPRTAFATPERFPGIPLIAEWPQEVLPSLRLDRYTAVALLTHDPRIDDPALRAALAAECFYVGALGSRKTHAKRLERLRAAGFGEEALARIHAPIGLDIGAVSPSEIAISIVAEIIAALRRKPLRSEKEKAA